MQIAVQVPIFETSIEFAQVNALSATTLHCVCTDGIAMTIYKDSNSAPLTLLNVSVPLDHTPPSGAKYAWRVIDVAFAASSTKWLALPTSFGAVGEQIQLLVSGAGLSETTGVNPYMASIELEVAEANGEIKTVFVRINATVRASVSASHSGWGTECGSNLMHVYA